MFYSLITIVRVLSIGLSWCLHFWSVVFTKLKEEDGMVRHHVQGKV